MLLIILNSDVFSDYGLLSANSTFHKEPKTFLLAKTEYAVIQDQLFI